MLTELKQIKGYSPPTDVAVPSILVTVTLASDSRGVSLNSTKHATVSPALSSIIKSVSRKPIIALGERPVIRKISRRNTKNVYVASVINSILYHLHPIR